MNRLTEAQRVVLQAMADGHEMVFSQDGDMAWLWPKHPTGFLSDEQTIGLREMGYIKPAPYDEDVHVRFGPPDIISEAGRAALTVGKPEQAVPSEDEEDGLPCVICGKPIQGQAVMDKNGELGCQG